MAKGRATEEWERSWEETDSLVQLRQVKKDNLV